MVGREKKTTIKILWIRSDIWSVEKKVENEENKTKQKKKWQRIIENIIRYISINNKSSSNLFIYGLFFVCLLIISYEKMNFIINIFSSTSLLSFVDARKKMSIIVLSVYTNSKGNFSSFFWLMWMIQINQEFSSFLWFRTFERFFFLKPLILYIWMKIEK